MMYDPDDLSALISEVESQGGAFLPETCDGQQIAYAIPGSERTSNAMTCRCNHESMAVIPYDPGATQKDRRKRAARGGGFARICVNCDLMGHWPRFEHVITEED